MNTVLSICIPTYNRSKFLLQTLDNLLPQLQRHAIPVFIRDNASLDDTVKVLEVFQREKYPNLFFKTNPENLGFDRNVKAVVEDATTEYCWLFSDDDLLAPGAVDAVLPYLKEGIGLMLVNASTHPVDFARVIESRKLDWDQDRRYEVGEHNRFLMELGAYLGCMGAYVVQRSRFLESTKHPCALGFAHLSYAMRYLPACRATVIARPFVQFRDANASWNTLMFRILMLDWPGAVWSLGADYDEAAKRAVTIPDRIWSLRFLLGARALGFYDGEQYEAHIAPRICPKWGVKKMAYWITRIPRGLFCLCFGAYIRVAKVPGYHTYLEAMRDASRK